MIPNNQKHKEKSKQSNFIPKPKSEWWDHGLGNPEGMGLYNKQKKNSIKKNKGRK